MKRERPSNRDRLIARAYRAVRLAIDSGRLPPIDTCKCVDCGASAECYDHRDYTQALKVDPVCKACNNRRGPGWPYPDKAIDGRAYKLPARAGYKWASVEGEGEGFAPLEAKLVDGFTTQDIDDALIALRDAERMRLRHAGEENRQRVTATTFSTGKQGGIRNVTGIARAEYFKRRDPWYV